MSYVRDRFRQKARSLKFIMAFSFICSFLWADFSFADSWSCSPPPNDAVAAEIARYPSSYLVSKDEYIVRLVESSLERRLNFKSKIVSCDESSCRISKEFMRFIGRKVINIPYNSIQMSICAAHNPDCFKVFCDSEYPESYDVLYAWKGGKMRLKLDISKRSNKLSINRTINNKIEDLEPQYLDFYQRYIGVTKNSRLLIVIATYVSEYYE